MANTGERRQGEPDGFRNSGVGHNFLLSSSVEDPFSFCMPAADCCRIPRIQPSPVPPCDGDLAATLGNGNSLAVRAGWLRCAGVDRERNGNGKRNDKH